MANNPLLTFMQNFSWISPTNRSDQMRHPGAPAKFEDTRNMNEPAENPEIEAATKPTPARRTIRVGGETVELDVEAVKQFVETVKEKYASTN
jgi:hypothetical protein